MGLVLNKQPNIQLDQQHAVFMPHQKLQIFLHMWEIYPILFITAFLRLYRIDTAAFMNDETIIFRMARDAISYGFWPITSNRSSLLAMNPPLVVYLFVIPAAVSANPLWGEIMVGLLNTTAVLLAYFFTRRYYGRLTATFTALFYATSVGAIIYSRSIWQQNLLPFFTMLLLFMFFRGVVDRRKGWLAPAILLLGMLYQLHGSAILLTIPLFFAMLFAFKTIRLRDIVLASILLLLLFAPFIYWNFATHFSDAKILQAVTYNQVVTDSSAFQLDRFFLSPYTENIYAHIDQLPTDPRSILVHRPLSLLRAFLQQVHDMMPQLLICAIAMAGMQIVLPWRKTSLAASSALRKYGFFKWWADFLATPYRQGLVVLLSWQTLPLLLLLHHSIELQTHYFIIFLPGQFILIALLITGLIEFIQRHLPDWSMPARWCLYATAAFIISAQLVGSTGALLDNVNGSFDGNETYPAFNDLSSLQHAIAEADWLAQQHHIRHIYISTSYATRSSLRYLAEQVKTPTTVFDTDSCFVLPSSPIEPAIFLSQPDSPLDDTIIKKYTKATLVDEPRRLGGNSFKLYILTTNPTPSPTLQSFTHGIQLLSSSAHQLQSIDSDQQWLITRWRMMASASTAPRTIYSFHFQIQSGSTKAVPASIGCALTSIRAGDQLLVLQETSRNTPVARSITIQASSSTQVPATFKLGSLNLVSYDTQNIDQKTLQTADRKVAITLPTS